MVCDTDLSLNLKETVMKKITAGLLSLVFIASILGAGSVWAGGDNCPEGPLPPDIYACM